MLVSAKEMLDKALAGHYAVPQFNINNLEWTKSILLACEEVKSPVILGVSEGAGKYMCGFETVTAMVKAMDKSLGITVPVALHLDHGILLLKRTLKRQKNWLLQHIRQGFPLRRKSVPSVVKKTVLSEWENARIRRNARRLLILA